MEAGYRKAAMVELHDAHTTVRIEDCPVERVGWRDAFSAKGTYLSVNGSALGHLLQAMTIPFDADMLYGGAYNVLFRQPASVSEEDAEGPFQGLRVETLWVRPEGERTLHLRLVGRMDQGQAGAVAQELTYAGSYTIWWSEEEKA